MQAGKSPVINVTEQFTFCGQFVEEVVVTILFMKNFLFAATTTTTGVDLHCLLMNEIQKHNLILTTLLVEGMLALEICLAELEVQARYVKEYLNAKYVHCCNHCLNLAICRK